MKIYKVTRLASHVDHCITFPVHLGYVHSGGLFVPEYGKSAPFTIDGELACIMRLQGHEVVEKDFDEIVRDFHEEAFPDADL